MSGEINQYNVNASEVDKLKWILDVFRPHFDVMVINPAKDIAKHHNGAMPAFLWITCAIDWLAGFMVGKDRNKIGGAIGTSYIDFINGYFPPEYKCHAYGIYNLRTGLVHNYSIKEARQNKRREYALTHGERAGTHFALLPNGQFLLNLDDLLDDFVLATESYFEDVRNNAGRLHSFIECYEREGFLYIFQIS